ncbi:MAG: nucleotide exchange factor GrpE [Pseudomonadota bacterium]
MPPRPPVQRVNLTSGPSLLIDDDLINEALAAVERRAAPPAPAPADDDEVLVDITPEEDGSEVAGAGGEITIESLSDDLIVAIEPEAPPSPPPAPAGHARAPLFAIPEDLAEDESASDPGLTRGPDDEERTDPAGIRPAKPAEALDPRPITADPVELDRVARLRKKSRALQARLAQANADLDQERQALQAARARARFADLARQEAEEQREGLDRFARSLRTRILALEEEVARLQRRGSTEVAQSRQIAAEATIRELLPILDNLQLALSHVETDLDRFVPGVEMVASQFVRSLERLGVERIEATPGTRFDPAVHEAILTMPSDGIAEGHVLEEVRAGYTLKARLLRAAQVSVAGPPLRVRERVLPPAIDDALPSASTGDEE